MLPKLRFAEYLGRTLRKIELSDFSLSEVAYSSRARLRAHAHEHAIFSLHLAGGCTERVGSREWSLEPLTLRYHPPDEVHADRVGEAGWRIFIIELAGPGYHRLRDQSLVPREPTIVTDAAVSTLGRRLYEEFATGDAPAASMEALVLDIAAGATGQTGNGHPTRVPSWLRVAEEALRARFAQSIVLKDVARDVGVHPVHLARVFHRVYGQTMGDFIRALRVDFACRWMRDDGSAPLAHIARRAGFADQSHFCRTFRRIVGTTPSEYRGAFSKDARSVQSDRRFSLPQPPCALGQHRAPFAQRAMQRRHT